MTWLLREKSIYFENNVIQVGCLNCDYLFLLKTSDGKVFAVTKNLYCHLLGKMSSNTYFVSSGNRVLEVRDTRNLSNTLHLKLYFIEFGRLNFAREMRLSFDAATRVTQLLDDGFLLRSSLLGTYDHYFSDFEGRVEKVCEDCEDFTRFGDIDIKLSRGELYIKDRKFQDVLSIYPSAYPYLLFFTEREGYVLNVETLQAKQIPLSTLHVEERMTYSRHEGDLSIEVEDKEILIPGGNLHQMCCKYMCVVNSKVATVYHLLHYQEEIATLTNKLPSVSEEERDTINLTLANLDLEYQLSKKI